MRWGMAGREMGGGGQLKVGCAKDLEPHATSKTEILNLKWWLDVVRCRF